MILNQEKSNEEFNETTLSIYMRRIPSSSGNGNVKVVDMLNILIIFVGYTQGRRQKNFQGEGGREPMEKRRKIAKKHRKIALLSLYLLYLHHA